MLDVGNKGLNIFPSDVYIKGNLRWWASPKSSTDVSQAIVLSNRDLSLKNWLIQGIANNIISVPGSQFFEVANVASLPTYTSDVPLYAGDRAYVADIGNGQEGLYIYESDAWNGPIIVSHSSKFVAASNTGGQLPTPTNNIMYYIDATSTSVSTTLPDPTKNLYEIVIKKIDSSLNTVTINPYDGETIDGLSSVVLYSQGETVSLLSNGTNYYSISTSSSMSSSAGVLRYDVSNGCTVKASRAGITSTLVNGLLTLTVPVQCEIYGIVVRGTNSSSYIGADGYFRILIDYQWDNSYNTSDVDLLYPTISVYECSLVTLGGPTRSYPMIEILTDPPQRTITKSETNDLEISFSSLGVYSNWAVSIQL